VRAVFRRALRELVKTLEKRTCGATDTPRAPRNKRATGDRIPAQVRREVRQRDGNRCTWVTEDGTRCEARSQLQYDHVQPLGKGGTSAAHNLRLLCPAHNQLAAEREYGEGFMHRVRERQREATERIARPPVPVARAASERTSCAPARAAAAEPTLPCP